MEMYRFRFVIEDDISELQETSNVGNESACEENQRDVSIQCDLEPEAARTGWRPYTFVVAAIAIAIIILIVWILHLTIYAESQEPAEACVKKLEPALESQADIKHSELVKELKLNPKLIGKFQLNGDN